MNNSEKRLFTKIKKNNKLFIQLQETLYLNNVISTKDAQFLFSIALIFIDEYKRTNAFIYMDYAYYIIVRTCIKVKDFRALYDFSVNYGFYPVARKIVELNLIKQQSINNLLSETQIDDFEIDNKIMTYEQSKIFDLILNCERSSVSFVAPTSYGKSDFIFRHIDKYSSCNNIGIIVPTKALIDQVIRDTRYKIKDRRIISHDDEYTGSIECKIIAIITQERALRLFEKGLIFDVLYIDEAHTLMDFNFQYKLNNRSLLLSRVIRLHKKYNKNTKIVYLSPVTESPKNYLQNDDKDSISEFNIKKDLKIYDINYLNQSNEVYKYDKYLGAFIDLNEKCNWSSYIYKHSKTKNFHFLYRPKFVEQYASQIYELMKPIQELNLELQELCSELSSCIHPHFKLITYLNKGIIYLHSKIPSNIKNYILSISKTNPQIKHIVANSVILEGINFPIDNLYYISGNGNMKDMKNLIGRVNRLNEIFSENNKDISKIVIPIHFIELKDYPQLRNGSMMKKITKFRDNHKDSVKNPLLENSVTKSELNGQEIVKYENELLQSYNDSSLKNILIISGVDKYLNFTTDGIEVLRNKLEGYDFVHNIDNVLDVLHQIFFTEFVIDKHYSPELNIKRLEHEKAIAYYKMFISDLKTKSFSERVEKTVQFWKENYKKGFENKIYIGSSFGEIDYESVNYYKGNRVYVNMNEYINDELKMYNFAIVKIQIDEDFVSNEIMSLLKAMEKMKIITEQDLDAYFYGTNDLTQLQLIKSGLTRNSYLRLKNDNQLSNLSFDSFYNLKSNYDLIEYIKLQKGLYRFELEQFFPIN